MAKSETILLRVEPELKVRVETAAKDAGLSMSEFIRRLIERELDCVRPEPVRRVKVQTVVRITGEEPRWITESWTL